MGTAASELRTRTVGRYALYSEIAAGGMATVHFGRLLGGAGFSRLVAVKRLYPHLAKDPDFAAMFIDEARLASRIRHPNVVQTLDVVRDNTELLVVMEYVHGIALSALLRAAKERGQRPPFGVVAAIVIGLLHGLDAAHAAQDEAGKPLGLVHRDVSPQNVLIGADGVARVLDFGVAKAAGRVRSTPSGEIRGKIAYMAPEQLRGVGATRQSDLYSASVVLWEALTARRLFDGDTEGSIVTRIFEGRIPPPSSVSEDVPIELDAITLRGLAREPERRFFSAQEMASALEASGVAATLTEVKRWIHQVADDMLAARADQIARIERPAGEEGREPTTARLLEGPSHRPTRRPSWLVLVSLGAFAACIAVAASLLRSHAPARPSARAPRGETPSLSPSVASAVSAPSAEPMPPTSEPSAAPTSPKSRVAAPRRGIRSADKRPTKAVAPMTKSLDCDPPYTIDSLGLHHMRAECL
jgi:serine/threonine-protein kinase